jgi:hypothetical protein
MTKSRSGSETLLIPTRKEKKFKKNTKSTELAKPPVLKPTTTDATGIHIRLSID